MLRLTAQGDAFRAECGYVTREFVQALVDYGNDRAVVIHAGLDEISPADMLMFAVLKHWRDLGCIDEIPFGSVEAL